MRRRLPALLGTSLLLVGCTTGQPDPTTGGGTDTTTAPESDAAAIASAANLLLGEWAPADCPVDQPCDVEFRISDILVADTCEFGLKPGEEPLADDTWVLTLYSEARSGLTADGKAHIFGTPKTVDAEGEMQQATYDQPCADNPAHANFEYLLTGIEENSEAQYADMLAVPAGTEALFFEGRRIKLPDPGEAASAVAGQGSGADADTGSGDVDGGAAGGAAGDGGETGGADDATDVPYQVSGCETDGQALFSDGVRRPVNDCANDTAGDSDGQDEGLPYHCADTGEQVTDPSDCVTTPPNTPNPAPTTPTTATTTPTPTVSHPNPGSFENDYEAQLWTDCANGEVRDKLLCSTMYELYGSP